MKPLHHERNVREAARALFFILAIFVFNISSAQCFTPAPVVNDKEACFGDSVHLSVENCNGGTIRWYHSPFASTPFHTGSNYSFLFSASRELYVSCTINGCESSRVPLKVSSKTSRPSISVARNETCVPGNFLMGTNGCENGLVKWYEFKFKPDNTALLDMPLHEASSYLAYLTSFENKFFVTCTVDGCESEPAMALIYGYSYPTTSPQVSNVSRCGPGEVSFTIQSMGIIGSYRWYTQPTGGLPLHTTTYLEFPLTYTTIVTETTSFWVSFVNEDGCEGPRGEVIATVHQPGPPQTTDASRCGPGIVTLNAAGCGDGVISWYNSEDAPSPFSTGNSISPYVGGTRDYWVTCTINGCESEKTKITAMILPEPAPRTPSVNWPARCGPGMVEFNASGCEGGIIRWYSSFTGGDLLHIGPVYSTYVSATKDFYLSCTLNNCESNRTLARAIIEWIPDPPVTTGVERCGPGVVTMRADAVGWAFGGYYWYTEPEGGAPVFYSQGGVYSPFVTATTDFWVAYNSDNSGNSSLPGCRSQRSKVTAVVHNPVPPSISPVVINAPGTANLVATGCSDGIIKWYSAQEGGDLLHTGTNYSPFINATRSFWASCSVSGCESSRTMVTVTVNQCNMTVTIPAAFALSKGVQANTVYQGYAPASSISLRALVSGGTAPYTYAWSHGGVASSVSVSPGTAQTYTVSITDKNGCSATASIMINSVDVRCGNKNDKVVICKKNPGKNGGSTEICVAREAVPAQLANGGMLGSCNPVHSSSTKSMKEEVSTAQDVKDLDLKISPNPTSNQFQIVVNSPLLNESVMLMVNDITGRLVQSVNTRPGQQLMIGANYTSGIYLFRVVQGNKILSKVAIKN
jgi:hypothetical protein